jgi:hypothetical protein
MGASKAKATISKGALSKARYLPQRLNTVQNLIFSALCLLKDGDAEDIKMARASLKESYEYLRMILLDVEDVIRELESS